MHRSTLPFLFAVAAGWFLTGSCDDKAKTADDKTPPEISVITPTAGQQYAQGDTIYFEADVEDESELSDLKVNLIIGTDTTLMWPDPPVGLGNITSYTINYWYVNPFNLATPAKVSFYALDKRDNSNTVNVDVELTN